jgi:anhydro-N-acetylmuramic acid kinase
MSKYRIIGLMSGTSLDGVDLAGCEFVKNSSGWGFKILTATTIPYPEAWIQALKNAHKQSAFELALLNKDYGHYLGNIVNRFIHETGFAPGLIASHGHTIFHRPELGMTYQLGDGASLSAVTGKRVICDFRTTDVALGGNGAPLVPIGDKLLFSRYTHCLNLGGISNISYDRDKQRIAYDISPCNMALNKLAENLGLLFDKGGDIARKGKVITSLLSQLNSLGYYSQPAPKSLGREWFEENFLPLLGKDEHDIPDLLRTVTEHIAYQVSLSLDDCKDGTLLITGGGAHNTFLVERIKNWVPLKVKVPDEWVVDFKEALIFAFLGLLRFLEEVNVFCSVTGSKKDHVAGAVYL